MTLLVLAVAAVAAVTLPPLQFRDLGIDEEEEGALPPLQFRRKLDIDEEEDNFPFKHEPW